MKGKDWLTIVPFLPVIVGLFKRSPEARARRQARKDKKLAAKLARKAARAARRNK